MKPWLVAWLLVLAAGSGGAWASASAGNLEAGRQKASVDLSSQLRQSSFFEAANAQAINTAPTAPGGESTPPRDRIAAPAAAKTAALKQVTIASSAELLHEPDGWIAILIGLLGAWVIARRRIASF